MPLNVKILLCVVIFLFGYRYYHITQAKIESLIESNAKYELAIESSEQTIAAMKSNEELLSKITRDLNTELYNIKLANKALSEKLSGKDLAHLSIAKPDLMEKLINRGTTNASRCVELLTGAQPTQTEMEAKNGKEFNPECPWLFNSD